MVTGYKEDGKHSSAGDKRRGFALSERYALDSFSGRNQVGAALDYAISRLAQEYKQNNADPARKLRKQLPTSNLHPPTSFADFSLGGLHASAHNFRKFSTDYMGSGEGAQAYGWGLYFAENPKTNRAYFNQFNKQHTALAFQQNGTRIPEADYTSILNNIFLKHATPQYPAKTLISAIRSLMSGKFVKNRNINAEIAEEQTTQKLTAEAAVQREGIRCAQNGDGDKNEAR